ncbi:MAG: hypothetical protein ABJD97_17885 [Betaproteobacteria bacterium]
MNQATEEQTPSQRARAHAWDAVKDHLSRDYTYSTTVDDKPLLWVFIFLPEARVRGGGAQVTVEKASLKVTDVTFLQ